MTRIAPESVDHPLAVNLEQVETIGIVIDGGRPGTGDHRSGPGRSRTLTRGYRARLELGDKFALGSELDDLAERAGGVGIKGVPVVVIRSPFGASTRPSGPFR